MSDQSPRSSASRLETELLANERTFLAWVRTSIALMSLGFVIARFGLWLGQLSVKINPQAQTASSGLSLPIGATMIAFGAFLTLFAGWRYHVVNRAIERGKIEADRRLVLTVCIAVSVIGSGVIAYMIFAAART